MRTLLDETPNAPTWASSVPPPAPAMVSVQRSPWHSPVPYLFGGLAAMLGLIAFALLILACSYWKISGNPSEGGEEGDVEKGAAEKGKEVIRVYEEKIVVIMAGDEKPTYLATPVCSRGPSFGDSNKKSEDQETKKESADDSEKVNKDGNNNNSADSVADHHDDREQVIVQSLGGGESTRRAVI
ncbi:protein GLUTAMINE DUMPER 2-like [Punica granatum]|uniref:Protein GLUTAMINE DUMPER 2-like n=1 Tax=Punica granatum TaxID=22663 RepID=A0A6P8BUQ3_PUNGR|nr:protein GLUTAMINE DUMPER 2-like [Punica granatum]